MTLRPGGWGSRCAPRQWSGRRQSPQKIVRPRPGRSACPEATAGPNPFRGRPSGLTRWRCGSAGGGVITCPSVARQGSSKGRPGGEMQSGTSARHYLFARGPAKAARQRQPGEGARRGLPGGAAVRGWKSNRSQSGTCGGVPVCGPARVRARRQPPAPTPSAAARQGAHGRGPWRGPLGTLPGKNRAAGMAFALTFAIFAAGTGGASPSASKSATP